MGVAGSSCTAAILSRRCLTWVNNGRSAPSAQCPVCLAGSSGRCNTGTKSFGRGLEAQSLAGPFIELPSHSVELRLRVDCQIRSLGEVLPQQAVGVLIGSTLPRALRITEVDVDFGRQG